MPLTPWPMYFAKLALSTPRLTLKVGDPFPVQSKPVIRGLASAYGCTGPQYDTMPFNELPFVEVRDVTYGLERALSDATQGTSKAEPTASNYVVGMDKATLGSACETVVGAPKRRGRPRKAAVEATEAA